MLDYQALKKYSFFIFLLIFYFNHMPTTVQTLDTGELITNSYFLRVIHPPGYPLFTWLYSFFTHLPLIGNPFFKGSLLTIFLSLSTLFFIYTAFSNTIGPNKIVPILALTAFSPIYWRYSLLPDVFLLHLFFVSLICFFYIKNSHQNLLLFVWCLSIAHHHTTIFLLPLVIDSFILNKNPQKYLYIILGSGVTFLLYVSLLFLDTTHVTSWGSLQNTTDLLNHFFRTDYGTFSLKTNGQNISIFDGLFAYFSSSIQSLFPLYFVILVSLVLDYRSINRKQMILFSSYFFYLGSFFSLANISPQGQALEVLSRFFLMPNIVLIFLALSFYTQSSIFSLKRFQVFTSLIIFINISFNYFNNRSINNFSQNTIMEDWAKNKLRLASENKNNIILESADSKLFSMYYVQNVLNHHSQVKILSEVLMFHKWYFEKIKNKIPEISLNEIKFLKQKNYDYFDDLIIPNISKFSFLVDKLGISHPEIGSQYTPLGTFLNKKMGKNTFKDFILRRQNSKLVSILKGPCLFYYEYTKYLIKNNLKNHAQVILDRELPYCPNQLCKFSPKNKKCLTLLQ